VYVGGSSVRFPGPLMWACLFSDSHILTSCILFCDRLQYCTPTHSTSLATTYLCRSVTVFAVETLTRVVKVSICRKSLGFPCLSQVNSFAAFVPLIVVLGSVDFRFFNWVFAISVLSFQWGLFVNLCVNFRLSLGSLILVFSIGLFVHFRFISDCS